MFQVLTLTPSSHALVLYCPVFSFAKSRYVLLCSEFKKAPYTHTFLFFAWTVTNPTVIRASQTRNTSTHSNKMEYKKQEKKERSIQTEQTNIPLNLKFYFKSLERIFRKKTKLQNYVIFHDFWDFAKTILLIQISDYIMGKEYRGKLEIVKDASKSNAQTLFFFFFSWRGEIVIGVGRGVER